MGPHGYLPLPLWRHIQPCLGLVLILFATVLKLEMVLRSDHTGNAIRYEVVWFLPPASFAQRRWSPLLCRSSASVCSLPVLASPASLVAVAAAAIVVAMCSRRPRLWRWWHTQCRAPGRSPTRSGAISWRLAGTRTGHATGMQCDATTRRAIIVAHQIKNSALTHTCFYMPIKFRQGLPIILRCCK